MKKALAICFVAFYLLVATGMFVCIVHCAAESFLFGIITAHAEQKDSDHYAKSGSDHHDSTEKHNSSSEKKKDCTGEEDCSCCDQHGTYIIKENISPTFNLKVPQVLLTGYQPAYFNYTFLNKNIGLFDTWPESHAPPGKNNQPIYIKIRSLLI
ncbi:hypothetical protein [Rubrolithibacter danxiaensis]|uniref:hypothetical protein n=1 Tax=Rubrolithibacter danxiaensis TaxID=3390805 RepID=UPI003BF8D854